MECKILIRGGSHCTGEADRHQNEVVEVEDTLENSGKAKQVSHFQTGK